MGIFAKKPDQLEDTLDVLEHPWASFRQLRWQTRVPLGFFMALYLPFALLVAAVCELCFRLPHKLCCGARSWRIPTDDVAFWSDMAFACPRRKLLMIALQDEIVSVPSQLDGTSDGASSEKQGQRKNHIAHWNWHSALLPPVNLQGHPLDNAPSNSRPPVTRGTITLSEDNATTIIWARHGMMC